MITLAHAMQHVGSGVVYRNGQQRSEDGVITSVNSVYVFVRYSGDQFSKATPPQFLELLQPCRSEHA